MTTTSAHWDAELSMPIEQPHAVDPNHAAFMRWLVEHGLAGAEHGIAGPSSGELTEPEPVEKGG